MSTTLIGQVYGNSTPLLTARYSHRRLYDLAGAVGKLPPLVPTDTSNADAIPLRLTGTDGGEPATAGIKPDNVVRLGVPPGVPTGYAGPHQSALPCNNEAVQSTPQANRKTLENKEPGADLHRVASIGLSAPPRARTEDPLIKSQQLTRRKLKSNSLVTSNTDSRRTTGRTRLERRESEGGIADADLAALVTAWPTLPDPIRAAIRALVAAARTH